MDDSTRRDLVETAWWLSDKIGEPVYVETNDGRDAVAMGQLAYIASEISPEHPPVAYRDDVAYYLFKAPRKWRNIYKRPRMSLVFLGEDGRAYCGLKNETNDRIGIETEDDFNEWFAQ
jgi:hypothetical protein